MPYETRANTQHQPVDQPCTLTDLKAEVLKLSDVLCKKIDSLRDETNAMHRKISDIETSLKDTSDRALNIENNEIPKLRKEQQASEASLKKKILQMEIYLRKPNLLFYGVPQHKEENVYVKLKKVFIDLGIPSDEANRILITNAHRLPRKSRETVAGAAPELGPDPIIAKFVIMRDRQRILEAYDNQVRSKNKDRQDHQIHPDTPATPSTRISVRTDLPPEMKFRRGKLASIAYQLRKEKNLNTKLFVRGTDVILQFKDKDEREWKTYTD